MTLWHENLRRIIAKLDALMPSHQPANGMFMQYEELRAFHTKVRAVLTQVAHGEGGRYSSLGNTERLRLAGVESTCTSGPSHLVRNWQKAARRQLDASDDPINLQGSGPAPILPREATS